MWTDLPRIGGIVVVDLVLSGDNALLIGMACAGLPTELRRRGILAGSLAAVAMRVLLATLASVLLTLPFLRTLGGLSLVWIAYRLSSHASASHRTVRTGSTLWEAVRTIAVADLVMSLDNVLALGGLSHGSPALLLFGLGLTVPAIMWGSSAVAALLARAPWLMQAGAALLAWTAGGMVAEDPLLRLPQTPLVPALATALVLGASTLDQALRQ